MPLDSNNYHSKKIFEEDANPRIYICETGEVRVETRNLRRSFAPEEFVNLLREQVNRKAKRNLSVLPFLKQPKQRLCPILILLLSCLFIFSCASKETPTNSNEIRVVTIGGAVTETAFALGAESKIVGVDTSSIFPEAATKLPQVGYQRQISAEGVLSLKPNLVIAMAESGPPAVIQQIESTGLKILKVSGEHTIEGTKAKIREIAQALNLEAKGVELIKKLDADLSEANICVSGLKSKPKVVFIYSRGGGAPNVSGTKTAGDAMINLAGGQNAFTEFENYKPLTPEALVAAAPDFILLPTLGLESMGGIDGVLKIAGVAETPAGKNRRIIAVDDLVLLGFGPRTGEGVRELCSKLSQ